ncbi:recombinase family protein [Nonomuraea sp. NPDC047897]|uniref:recombinase family protein n=1 Tax=Nonomuraea sp. NPDC047897 TaxID=3364346 RepID=UPI00371DC2EC
MSLRAALYNRVSQDRRRREKSVTEQDQDGRRRCAREGWNVVATYTDNDRSASRFATKAREEWRRLLDDLDAEAFDLILLWEPSRGDRELEMWARLLNTCRRLGVLIHITSHDHTYDVRKPRDWRALAEEGVDAAYESEKTSQRVRRSTAATAAAGMPHGKLLYGYRREYDPATGQLLRQVVDSRQLVAIAGTCMAPSSRLMCIGWYNPADVIRECAGRILQGQALYEIAMDLNRRGVPTPRRALGGWLPSQVKEQLTNPGYIARRIHQGKDIGPAQWPAILDVDVFDACVARLSDPSRRRTRDTTIKHLLSGIALCGVCGGQMRLVKNRGKLAYSCYSRVPQGGSSFHVSRLQTRLESFVVDVILGYLTREDASTILAADEDAQTQVRQLEEMVVVERRRLEVFYDQAAEGELSPEGLKRIEQRLRPKIDQLEARVRAMRKARLPLLDDLVDADPAVVRARWEDLGLIQKREVIRALTDRIEVLPAGRGRINYSDWEFTRIVWAGRSAEEARVEVGERVEIDT